MNDQQEICILFKTVSLHRNHVIRSLGDTRTINYSVIFVCILKLYPSLHILSALSD